MRIVLLACLLALPARAEDEPASAATTFLSSFALSSAAGGFGALSVKENGLNRAIMFTGWNAAIPALLSVPLVSAMSPGDSQWRSTLPASIALRLATTLILLDVDTDRLGSERWVGTSILAASILAGAFETAAERAQVKLLRGRGAVLRLGVVSMRVARENAALGGMLEVAQLGPGRTFQQGPALTVSDAFAATPWATYRPYPSVSVDLAWRGEWHDPGEQSLGTFTALAAGAGISTWCPGGGCPLGRAVLGAEAGWRWRHDDVWRGEAALQMRWRVALSTDPFPEWQVGVLVGVG